MVGPNLIPSIYYIDLFRSVSEKKYFIKPKTFLKLSKKLKDFETAIENYFEFYKSKPGGMKFMPTPKLDMYYQGLYDILKSPHLHTIIMILLYKHFNEACL